MGTYVRNSRGRVTVNMPWRMVDYWHMTAKMPLEDFEFFGRRDHQSQRPLTRTWPRGGS
jgi:4-hydroxyacetophenone monooxygenase